MDSGKVEPSGDPVNDAFAEARRILAAYGYTTGCDALLHAVMRVILNRDATIATLRADLEETQAHNEAGRQRLAEIVGLTGDESTRWKWLLLEASKMRDERATLRAEVVAAGEMEAADRASGLSRAQLFLRERDEARRMLAECYVLSGADTDGNTPESGWEHLWRDAVAEVRRLREESEDDADYEAMKDARDAANARADAAEQRIRELEQPGELNSIHKLRAALNEAEARVGAAERGRDALVADLRVRRDHFRNVAVFQRGIGQKYQATVYNARADGINDVYGRHVDAALTPTPTVKE